RANSPCWPTVDPADGSSQSSRGGGAGRTALRHGAGRTRMVAGLWPEAPCGRFTRERVAWTTRANANAERRTERAMALIKVTDLAYGRLRAPDLDLAEEFLTQFGMTRAERTPSALYMRGTDAAHHLHVTEKGDPGFVGLAYYAASLDDLKRVAKAPGASGIESIDEPGGGKRVRLKEPNGYQVEVVYGIKPLKPIKVPRQPLNLGAEGLKRAGKVMRIHRGPARVKRIGHGVMAS